MQRFLFPAIVLFVFAACGKKQEKATTVPVATDSLDCGSYRTGKFIFKAIADDQPLSWQITRTDSIQTEVEQPAGYTTKLSVKWINPCTYQMLVLESNAPYPDSVQQMRKTIPFEVEIVGGTKDYYVFKAERGNGFARRDTVWVDRH